MDTLISAAYAQAPAGAPAAPNYMSMMILVVFVVVFYFLLIRPQQKKAKEHQAMLGKLVAGDEVITFGGILGRVIEVGESFVTVEIAEGTRIKVQRSQVSSLVPKGTYKSA